MKIKKYLLLYLIIAFIASVIVFVLYSPRAIVENPSTCSIVRIIYNPYMNQNIDSVVDIIEYDAEKILDCLNQYKEHRTLSKDTSYWLGDVEIEILIRTKSGMKSILLGNNNYSYTSYGKYKILHADSLKLELLDIMAINP